MQSKIFNAALCKIKMNDYPIYPSNKWEHLHKPPALEIAKLTWKARDIWVGIQQVQLFSPNHITDSPPMEMVCESHHLFSW